MKAIPFALSLPIVAVLALPLVADPPKSPSAGKDGKVTSRFTAKVLSVNATEKRLKVELGETIYTVNAYHAGRLLYWQGELAKAAGQRDVKKRLRRIADCQAHIAEHQLYLRERHDRRQAIEVQATDDVAVRTLHLPPVFDEKGRPRKYTPKELKELQGDPKERSYRADFGDLRAGQVVQVTVGTGKSARPSAKVGETSSKETDKGPRPKASDSRPLVTRIVIVKPAPES